jgi:hypothetical protein
VAGSWYVITVLNCMVLIYAIKYQNVMVVRTKKYPLSVGIGLLFVNIDE